MFIRIGSSWININQITDASRRSNGIPVFVIYLSNGRKIELMEESQMNAVEAALNAHDWRQTQND